MKKTLSVIIMFAIFLLIYFLQTNFFNWFTIARVKPNLFILFVLFIGLYAGKRMGVVLGIFFGICLDFFIGKTVGISAIMLGIVGYFGGYFDKTFSKESRITIMIMIMGTTVVYEMGTYFLNIVLLSSQLEILPFIKTVLIEVVYNLLLTIILYPLLRKAGIYIEELYKGAQILTRYF